MNQSDSGVFDFTVSSDDTNPVARAYLEPIVHRYVAKYNGDDAVKASAFLSGALKGLLNFVEPGDAIYLRSLGASIPEDVQRLWRFGHPDAPEDEIAEAQGPELYMSRWFTLWQEIRQELNYYKLSGSPMPELVALHYSGRLHGRSLLGEMPRERREELQGLLAPFLHSDYSYGNDLFIDSAVIERLRVP